MCPTINTRNARGPRSSATKWSSCLLGGHRSTRPLPRGRKSSGAHTRPCEPRLLPHGRPIRCTHRQEAKLTTHRSGNSPSFAIKGGNRFVLGALAHRMSSVPLPCDRRENLKHPQSCQHSGVGGKGGGVPKDLICYKSMEQPSHIETFFINKTNNEYHERWEPFLINAPVLELCACEPQQRPGPRCSQRCGHAFLRRDGLSLNRAAQCGREETRDS